MIPLLLAQRFLTSGYHIEKLKRDKTQEVKAGQDRNQEVLMEKAADSVLKLTDEEPSTDLGERMIPAMECLRVSNFDTLSLLLS